MKRLLISLVLLAVWSSALAFDPLASEARLAALPPPGRVPLDAELAGGPECPAQGFVGSGPISLAEVAKGECELDGHVEAKRVIGFEHRGCPVEQVCRTSDIAALQLRECGFQALLRVRVDDVHHRLRSG